MKHAYSGRIYVNGMSDQPNCIRRYNGQTALATFEIPIAQCNMMAERVVTLHHNHIYYSTAFTRDTIHIACHCQFSSGVINRTRSRVSSRLSILSIG